MTADAEAEAEIRRLADELFITTDLKDWTALRAARQRPVAPGRPSVLLEVDAGGRCGADPQSTGHRAVTAMGPK